MKCPHEHAVDVGETCQRTCWGRTEDHASGCIYVAASRTDPSVYDLSRIENRVLSQIEEGIARGRDKMQAWLKVIKSCEEMLGMHLTGCLACGKKDCEGGHDCELRARRLTTARSIIPLDDAVKVRVPAPVWRTLIKTHRHEMDVVYSTFKNLKET